MWYILPYSTVYCVYRLGKVSRYYILVRAYVTGPDMASYDGGGASYDGVLYFVYGLGIKLWAMVSSTRSSSMLSWYVVVGIVLVE